MADAQRVVELIFQGVDKTGAATQAALENAQKFTDTLGNIAAPVAGATTAVLKFEAALLTAGVGATLFAVKLAGDFDSAFREISTLIDKPISDLGEFRQAILDYAKSSTQPLEDVTSAIYNAISAGVDYADSVAAVAQAEKLAVAGKAGLNESLLVLVQSLNAYGLGMDDAERFSDALFQTVREGVTTLPQLAASLGNVTTAAATLDVPFETLLAAIATLTAGGAGTSEAVTRINAALSNLIKPSQQASATAAELGIEFNAQAVKAKGLEAVLLDVLQATGGNEETMARLFGSVEAVKAVFPLVGVQAEAFAEKLESLRNSSGAVSAAFDKMQGDIGLSSQRVKTALQALFIEIGTPLLDEFDGVAKAVAAIFNSIGVSVKEGQLGNLVKIVENAFKDVQATLERVARNLPDALNQADFSSFEKGLETIIAAIKGLFSNVDLSSTEGLKRAIEMVGTAFLGLQKTVAGTLEALKPFFDALVSIAQTAAKIDPEMLKLAGSIGGIAIAINTVLPVVNTLLIAMLALKGSATAGGAAGAAAAVGGLAAALGPAALLAAVAAAGGALGVFIAKAQEARDKTNDFSVTINGFGDGIDNVEGAVRKVARGAFIDYVDAAGRVIASTIASDEAFDEWARSSSKVGDALGKATAELDGVAGAVTKVVRGPFTDYLDVMGRVVRTTTESGESLEEWNARLLASDGVLSEAADANDALAKSTQAVFDTTSKIIPIYDAATGKIIGYEQNLLASGNALSAVTGGTDAAARSLKGITEETKKAEEITRLWNQEMARMQHVERLKLIEAQTAITTARMEADAKKAVAAFESISISINSTGETLSSLWDTLAGGNLDRLQEIRLEAELQKESERRDEALRLQKELTQAQIAEMRARTEAMQRGDAMIQIDGAGLQPHLEAFMWEILRAIQTRVNADGYEMLLGA